MIGWHRYSCSENGLRSLKIVLSNHLTHQESHSMRSSEQATHWMITAHSRENFPWTRDSRVSCIPPSLGYGVMVVSSTFLKSSVGSVHCHRTGWCIRYTSARIQYPSITAPLHRNTPVGTCVRVVVVASIPMQNSRSLRGGKPRMRHAHCGTHTTQKRHVLRSHASAVNCHARFVNTVCDRMYCRRRGKQNHSQ